MKPKTILILLCALTSLVVLSALVLHKNHQPAAADSGTKTFEVRGQIRAIDFANQTIRISHEEIPNYMPAMIMPFTVKDATLLKGLAAGDSVQFQLAVTDNDSWIARIEKVAGESPNQSPVAALSSSSPEDREAERVQVGEAVPDFTLVDQDGRPVHLSDFRGKAVVLTFIYTRCPLPNFCPLMSRNFADLEKRLSKE